MRSLGRAAAGLFAAIALIAPAGAAGAVPEVRIADARVIEGTPRGSFGRSTFPDVQLRLSEVMAPP